MDANTISSEYILPLDDPRATLETAGGKGTSLMRLVTLAIAVLSPAVSALTSSLTTLEQGLTMGLSNAAQCLGRIAGPLLGGVVFDISLEYPNYLGAIIMGIGFVVSLFTLTEVRVRAMEAK